MSELSLVVNNLKRLLKARGLSYRDLAGQLGLSESSVKRLFADESFSLARLGEVCRVLGVSFYDLAKMSQSASEQPAELSWEQEACLASDPKIFSYFYLLLDGGTPQAIQRDYRIERAEGTRILIALDKAGLIELHPGERVRLRTPRQVKWREDGPLQQLYAAQIRREFFESSFKRDDELLRLVSGRLTSSAVALLRRRLAKLLREFDELTEVSETLPQAETKHVSVFLALRPWRFSAISALRRR